MSMSLLSSLEDTYCAFGDKETNQHIIHSVRKLTGYYNDASAHIKSDRTENTQLYDDIIPHTALLTTNTATTIPTSKRSGLALNTFNNFDFILTGSNPDTFLFGNAYNRNSDLMTSQIQHLLNQYTTHAASNTTLLFHLFNVRQRHQNINGVSSTLRGDKVSMNEFVKLVNNEQFKNQLSKAAENPQGSDAKSVIHSILPLLRASGRNTSFGSMERRSGVSHMTAMTNKYGPASIFITIAPDDINNLTGFRLSFRSTNNTSFPATMTKENVDAIRQGSSIIGEGFVQIPTSYKHRVKAVINNPHSSSKEYKRLIEQVFGILVNIPVSYKHRKSQDYRQRGPGIFGEILAFYGVTETQKRGALHLHAILYGSISPYLLQRASHIDELCKEISEVLDDIYQAELSAEDHAHNMLLKGLRTCKLSVTQSDSVCPPAFLQHTDDESVNDIATKTCCYSGIHTHSFTCSSGTYGHVGCRLGYQCGLNKKTGPVQLSIVDDDQSTSDHTDQHSTVFDNLRVSTKIEAPSQSPFDFNNPLPNDEKRVITWDICRRHIPLENSHKSSNDTSLTKDKYMAFLKGIVRNDMWNRELTQHVTNATVNDLEKICSSISKSLPKRNGYVVCHNKILSSLMRCNTAVYNTSSLESSIAITMYLTTYFTKKKAPVEHMLSTLCQARKQIDAHPSSADDSGTSERTVRHFFQRTLNSLDVAQELSDTQVAASLCGVKSFFSSDIYSYLDVWTSYDWVMHEHEINGFYSGHAGLHGHVDDDNDDNDDNQDSTGTSDEEVDHACNQDIDFNNDDDDDEFNDQSIANGKSPKMMHIILAH